VPATARGPQELIEEYGYDHAGGDYDSFEAPSLDACQAACRKDSRCQAYTYLGRKRRCYLKDGVHPARRSADAVTGVKEGYGEGGGRGGRHLTEERGYDRRGNDYRSFGVPAVAECKRACAGDRRCQAYTFLTRTTTCYLKDRAGDPQRQNGAVTGFKK
jgi:hypothetical protein